MKAKLGAGLLMAILILGVLVARPFAAHADTGSLYVDPTLRFSLALPPGWLASPAAVTHASASQATLTLTDPAHPASRMRISVARTPTAGAAFAAQPGQRGQVGAYPAIVSTARAAAQSPQPCLSRVFLAGSDYVTAQLCGAAPKSETAQFLAMLATYQPAASADALAAARVHPAMRSAPATCASLAAAYGSALTGDPSWGHELAAPTDPRWGGLQAPGVSVCSNWLSGATTPSDSDTYLFQCVELANRFINEEWGIPWLDGNAGMYLDYALGDTHYPGTVHQLNSAIYPYSISEDASQGTSSFRPGPGDLLIFQDVSDPTIGWNSGLIGTGHVAVIVATDATSVSIFQENFDWAAAPDTYYFQTLPLTQVTNGWHITPKHVGDHRITRGWIHFAVNSTTGSMPFGAIGRTATGQLDAFATGADHALWHNPQSAPGVWAGWARIGQPAGVNLDGTPVVGYVRGQGQEAYVTGSDGQLWLSVQQLNGAWGAWQALGAPPGVRALSDPTLAIAQTTEVVSLRGSDGAVWERTRDLFTGDWSPWQSLGMPDRMSLAGAPVVVAHDATLDLFVEAQPIGDGVVLLAHRTLNVTEKSAAWSAWESLGTPSASVSLASMPSIVTDTASSTQIIFVTGADGNLWGRWQASDGAWSAWQLLPCAVAGRPIVTLHNGILEVLARGPQGDLLDLTHADDATTSWAECASLGGALSAGHDLAAAVRVDGTQTLLARDASTRAQPVITLDATAKGVWSEWAPLPGLPATITPSNSVARQQ